MCLFEHFNKGSEDGPDRYRAFHALYTEGCAAAAESGAILPHETSARP